MIEDKDGEELIPQTAPDDAPDELADLRAKVETESKRATEAEQAREQDRAALSAAQKERDAAKEARQQAINARVQSDEAAVANAIVASDEAITALKQQWRTAREAGDVEAESEANDKLLDAKVRKQGFVERKQAIEGWKARAIAETEAAAEARPAQAQPQQQFTPRTKAWLDKHPEVMGAPKLFKKVQGAHFLAEAEGMEPDSDAYFAFIDKQMGYGKPEPKADEGEDIVIDTAKRATPAASIAAPPSRSGGGNGGAKPGQVRLTPGQHSAALKTFSNRPDISNEERVKRYAQALIELRAEGALN